MKKWILGFIVAALVAGSAADASAQCLRGWGCGRGRRAVVWRSASCGGYSSRLGAVGASVACSGGACRIESAAAPETLRTSTCSGGVCATELPPAPDTSACVGGVCVVGRENERPTGAEKPGLRGSADGSRAVAAALATPDELDAEILMIANCERANRGLAPLQFDDEHEAGATQVSRWNAASNVCRHYGGFGGGEICANAPTARGAVAAWIGSPAHYAHLFSARYNRVSVGVATRPDGRGGYYRYYTFRLFYRPDAKAAR